MKRVFGCLALISLAGFGFNQVTVLVSIPVADIKGIREVEVGHLVTGNERHIDKRYSHFGYAIVGVHERVEAAYSTDYNGTNLWGFKVKLLDDKSGQYAVSFGCQNVRGRDSNPFAVGRINWDRFRFHAGWYRNDMSRLILGVDTQLFPGATLAVDHWSGDGGSTWAGVFYGIPGFQGLTANLFVGFPSDKSSGILHTVGLAYAFRF